MYHIESFCGSYVKPELNKERQTTIIFNWAYGQATRDEHYMIKCFKALTN